MNWRSLLILSVAWGSGCTPSPPAPSTAQWDSSAAQEARAQVEKTMSAFAAMNVEDFKAGLAEDVISFELDLENKPLRLGSRNDAIRFAEESFAGVKKMGATLALDFHTTTCRATTTLAYCTVEFDLKVKMADGNTMTQPSRNSVVLFKGQDGWKWSHWHSSLAVAPAPPPASQPPSAR